MFLLWGKHIRKYYLRYFIFVLLGVAALISVDYIQLRIPEIIGEIVDKLNQEGSIDINSAYFANLIKEVFIVAAVMFGGRIVWRLSLFYASHRIEERIRNEMFLKAERLDLSYYHDNKVGTIMSWFTNDVESLSEFLGWGTLMMIDGVFLTTLALTKMFLLDYSLSLIMLLPIALIVLWGALVESKMSKIWRLRQESNDDLYDYSQENFTGIRVIKAFVKENQQIIEFSKHARKNRDINVKFTAVSVFFDVIIEIIIAGIAAILIGFGGWFVYGTVTGTPISLFGREVLLEPGQLVTFYGYFDSLIWPLIALGQVVTMFSQARTSYSRIEHYLDSDERLLEAVDAVDVDITGKIEFKDFSFKYKDSEIDSLSNISLTINPGENIGIIGTVGSGKSTLVNALVRLFNVEEGTLFIDDVDIMKIKIASLRNGVSIAPQDNFLFSDTIKNNIAFSDVDRDIEEVRNAARFADVDTDISQFEEGYDSLMGENGHTVSGGQKQRISLARAYLKSAPILILDDSVSAVDLKTEERILDNIKEKRAGKTTIIIASRVSTVMELDKVIVLKNGTLEAFDTPKNLKKNSETFSKMVMLQELEKEKGANNG
ncbi:MAG: ABC transporter ATP-binding protein/permease [Bacilli bacterium]|nr:ABC transporter ATP-binding protein/permease [Bacilli bacterium]